MRLSTWATLVQIPACRLFGTKQLLEPMLTFLTEIWIEIQNWSFRKMRLKLSFVKWWPFCPGGDELNHKVRSVPKLSGGALSIKLRGYRFESSGARYFLPRKNSTFSSTTIQQSQMHACIGIHCVNRHKEYMYMILIVADYSFNNIYHALLCNLSTCRYIPGWFHTINNDARNLPRALWLTLVLNYFVNIYQYFYRKA